MKSVRIAAWVGVLLIAALLGYLTLNPPRPGSTGNETAFGVPFSLIAQDGKPITEQALRGKPSVLFFGFTHCPEVCPTTLFEMDGWLKTVDPEHSKLKAFFVTVDPQRDTPEVMKEYVSNVSDRIVGISGPQEKIDEVIKGYRVYAKKVPIDPAKPDGDYTMDHTASVFLIDSSGRFAGTIAYGENPDTAIKKLENLIAKG